ARVDAVVVDELPAAARRVPARRLRRTSPQQRRYDIAWASLRFDENTTNVLAHDAKTDKLNGAHEQYDDRGACPAAWCGMPAERVIQDPHAEKPREQAGGHAEIRHEVQRIAAEAHQTVHGQARECPKRVLRLTRCACRAFVPDADLS